MDINLAALGDVLADGENIMRGLNPAHCEGGLPTEGCFILKTKDRPEDGPSFGIVNAPPEMADHAPLGVRQGVTLETFGGLLPSLQYGVARINVGAALAPVHDRGVGVVQKDDELWGEYAKAHAMITGYQVFGNKELKDYRRHLVKLAASDVLRTPAALP